LVKEGVTNTKLYRTGFRVQYMISTHYTLAMLIEGDLCLLSTAQVPTLPVSGLKEIVPVTTSLIPLTSPLTLSMDQSGRSKLCF